MAGRRGAKFPRQIILAQPSPALPLPADSRTPPPPAPQTTKQMIGFNDEIVDIAFADAESIAVSVARRRAGRAGGRARPAGGPAARGG